MKYLAGLVILCLLAFWAYKNGFVDKPKNLKDITDGNIGVKDPCSRKNVEGNYSLIIRFENSENKVYEKGLMELTYEFTLKQDECTISSDNAKQVSSSIIDSTNHKRVVNLRDRKDIILTGEIGNDSLELELYLKNQTAKKCKVTATFNYPSKEIPIKEGKFFEDKECANSTGKAILQKIND